jgi:Tol biopolymer transport system component
MNVRPGSQLGPYEVVSPLGAGGMGMVWRAKDTRLARDVAIKILPPDFAANAALKARFEREAKTISQLNHPNVCTLFDVGHRDGTDYLVMELIDGPSLADRLREGPLSIELVLRHGTEIASALDAAHRQGIVHRDLKPGNVMLTKAGAKLLDFGLAKSGPLVTSTMSSVSRTADSPTELKPLTEQGTLLGTFQYMAPEQLEGQEVDARTDIFAFGALLYEMATGRRAFEGKNKTSLIAAIVSSTPPPVSQVVPLTPPALDHVIRKCLAKDPAERWQSIHDVADQLRWIAEAGSRAGEPAPLVARRKSRLRAAWGLHLVTALVAALATFAVVQLGQAPPRVVRSSLVPPDKARFDAISGAMALSPDGRRIAFIATSDGGKRMLWVRALDGLVAQPLAGTEEATHPFWSPDSRFLGFFSAGKLRRIDATGGPVQVLCDAASGRGGSWNREGTIVFTPTMADAIYRVSAAGGVPTQLTTLAERETSHRFPEFLPDGRRFLFLIEAAEKPDDPGSGFTLWAGSLDSSERKQILETPASARYAESGHVLFLRDRTLVAQRFDADALELEGEAVPVAENLARTPRWEATFSVSDSGMLAFQGGPGFELSSLVVVDREGRELATVGKPADYGSPVLSHDGTRVAAALTDPASLQGDIWILDIERGTSTRLTFDKEDDYTPLWSPDDRFVYFTSRRQGKGDIFRRSSAGTGADELVFADPELSMLTSLTADGSLGAVQTQNSVNKTVWDVSLLSLEDRRAEVFLATPFSEVNPQLSRDGRFLAYHSNESGRPEVYVQGVGGDGGKWQISIDGGSRPRWTRGDRELVFVNPDYKLMIVDVELQPRFTVSVPRPFLDPVMRQTPGFQYDVDASGSRVLVNRSIDQPGVAPVTLVQNWTAELPE